jgi:prepilin-type N-terminal cleavage/methylation domain-containing protein
MHSQRTFRPGRRGLTLIELLVSIGILAVMILAFSTILVQSQRFISASRAARKSYQIATSIARAIRSDVRQATQNGFLAIAAAADGSPRLVFTAAGVSNSLIQSTAGTGRIVCYGQVNNSAPGGGANNAILWRPAWVLADVPTPSDNPVSGTDVWNLNLAQIQARTKEQLSSIASTVLSMSPSISVPATTLSETDQLWQVLAHRCSRLSITWTNGTFDADNNLYWRGIVWNESSNAWITQLEGSATAGIEGASASYSALWTHHDQTLWPRAIRIRFRITDPDMPRDFSGTRVGNQVRYMDYEVVCSLGQ